ncbi:MAG: 16S rRNA (guanine(527)-N(7))-methyltransferase RsmG [bacterium]
MKDAYVNEIVEWNKKFNLTGLKTKEEIIFKLYDDSLNISKAADLSKKIKVVDIGCGAGLPGIPLKIEHPNIELTLIDSVAKKIEFVEHIIRTLKLIDTEAICGRAEDVAKDRREQFDLAVSRAVAKLNVLYEYCLPFVKVGGSFIAQKGPDIEEELSSAMSAMKILGGRLKEQIKVPSGFLVVIEKINPTPKEFPRRAGTPGKRPL